MATLILSMIAIALRLMVDLVFYQVEQLVNTALTHLFLGRTSIRIILDVFSRSEKILGDV